MTDEHAIITRPSVDVTAYEPTSIEEGWRVAGMIAKSGLLGKTPARPETVFFLMARGRELGFTTAQSIDAFHIMDGKPTLTAQAKVALCSGRSDICRYIRMVESADDHATWETFRVGHPEPTRHTYTMDDAERAGLLRPSRTGEPTQWQKRPKTMLRWRAATELIALVYPDLTLGLYTPDELGEVAEDQGRHVEAQQIRILDALPVDATPGVAEPASSATTIPPSKPERQPEATSRQVASGNNHSTSVVDEGTAADALNAPAATAVPTPSETHSLPHREAGATPPPQGRGFEPGSGFLDLIAAAIDRMPQPDRGKFLGKHRIRITRGSVMPSLREKSPEQAAEMCAELGIGPDRNGDAEPQIPVGLVSDVDPDDIPF